MNPSSLFYSALLSIGSCAMSSAQATGPVSLREAVASAWSKTETETISRAQLTQAEERLNQGQSTFFPRIDLDGTYQRNHVPRGLSPAASSSIRKDSATLSLGALQPLYQGGREYGALGQLEAARDAQLFMQDQNRLSTYAMVGRAYYDVLIAESDEMNLKTLVELSGKRTSELESRNRIGKSRRGDLLSAQATLASANASLEAARVAVRTAREQFAFLTGLSPGTPLQAPKPDEIPASPPPIQELQTKLLSRPDVKVAETQVKSANEEVSIAFGGHMPTLNAFGNYYLYRTGAMKDSKWDLGVTLSIPIFSGGGVRDDVRRAQALRIEQDSRLSQLKRSALRDLENAYAVLVSLTRQLDLMKKAVETSEQNYIQQNRDYGLGNVSNLDVISALNISQETKRQYDRIRLSAHAQWINLNSALGELPE